MDKKTGRKCSRLADRLTLKFENQHFQNTKISIKKRILKISKTRFLRVQSCKKNEINKILFSPLLTCHCSRGKDCALAWARVTQLAFGKGHFRKIQQPRFLPILRFQTRRLRRFLGRVRELALRIPECTFRHQFNVIFSTKSVDKNLLKFHRNFWIRFLTKKTFQ